MGLGVTNYNRVLAWGLAWTLALCASPVSSLTHAAEKTPRSPRSKTRIEHAKELLGRHYKKSAARQVERFAPQIERHVRDWTRSSLRGKWRKFSRKISDTILAESKRYGFDPVFLLSVIESESSFAPSRIGSVGEIGLMQIRPSTGRWMAERLRTKWLGPRTLHDPVRNIRLGAAYLAFLREKFDQHSRLYLAAYNMGPTGVENALEKDVWPKDYPLRVMERYIARYKQLMATRAPAGKKPGRVKSATKR